MKKIVKVQFISQTQIGRSAIPEIVVEPGRRQYDSKPTEMIYDPEIGLTITFKDSPYSQLVPNANIATLLLEEVEDVRPSKGC